MIKSKFDSFFDSVNLVFLPTTLDQAFEMNRESSDPNRMYKEDLLTIPANLAGLPAISFPNGFANELPIGAQFVGNYFSEDLILNLTKITGGDRLAQNDTLVNGWQPVIGLEVHVQLLTNTKLFSPSKNKFGEEANTLVDLIDMGLPGVLPVLNDGAVKQGIVFGLATNAEIAKTMVFDRKKLFLSRPSKRLSDYATALSNCKKRFSRY